VEEGVRPSGGGTTAPPSSARAREDYIKPDELDRLELVLSYALALNPDGVGAALAEVGGLRRVALRRDVDDALGRLTRVRGFMAD
jgi:hypothetical protein